MSTDDGSGTTTITDIRTVGIPVTDQDTALAFFADTLGFEKRLDLRAARASAGSRSPHQAPPSSVALIAGGAVGQDTGIRFMVPDAETEHTAMRRAVSRSGSCSGGPGVPPMYEFKDPDGNRFEIVEAVAPLAAAATTEPAATATTARAAPDQTHQAPPARRRSRPSTDSTFTPFQNATRSRTCSARPWARG